MAIYTTYLIPDFLFSGKRVIPSNGKLKCFLTIKSNTVNSQEQTNKQIESMSATTATISSATAVELSAAAAATAQEQGLEFQVRECYEDDAVESVVPAAADTDDNQDDSEGEKEESGLLMRTASSGAPEPVNETIDVTDVTADPNIKRVDFKDEATTTRILTFLESRGINTNKLVQDHIIKYGSRARVAFNDDGDIVGFALFDNEVAQEMLKGVSDTEIKQYIDTKPFIFCQLLIIDPAAAASAPKDNSWGKRLIDAVAACIVKNRKIGIVRVDADDEAEIELYRSCGFYTMADMGVPSYTSSKDNVTVLGYTPLGLEQTTEIFKKLYTQGARF